MLYKYNKFKPQLQCMNLTHGVKKLTKNDQIFLNDEKQRTRMITLYFPNSFGDHVMH